MAVSKVELYSFVVDLMNPVLFKKRFKTADNTQWEVQGFWTFLSSENSSQDLFDELAHVMIVKQKSHLDQAFEKILEAYPLEQTKFTTIKKTLSYPMEWFSVTFREYLNAFRPEASGSFQQILCTLTIIPLPCTTDSKDVEISSKRLSFTKRYRYSSLQNISSTVVKSITLKTVLEILLRAMQEKDEDLKAEAMDFIAKNFSELKTTELWQNFMKVHRELTTEILDMLVEHMSNHTERANRVLCEAVSKLDVQEE